MITKLYTAIKHGINLVKNSLKDSGIKEKRSSKWPALEKSFKKAHPLCACCGSNVRVQVHHKKPFHLHPELELDPKNLISLCMGERDCHLVIGHGNSFKAYNPNIDHDVKILSKDISKFSEIAKLAKANRLKE